MTAKLVNMMFAPQHSLAASTQNPAMSLFEMERPRDAKTVSKPAFNGLRTRIHRGLKAAQYTQMLRVLTRMSDDTLTQIGVSRSEIPAHAHFCIYGE